MVEGVTSVPGALRLFFRKALHSVINQNPDPLHRAETSGVATATGGNSSHRHRQSQRQHRVSGDAVALACPHGLLFPAQECKAVEMFAGGLSRTDFSAKKRLRSHGGPVWLQIPVCALSSSNSEVGLPWKGRCHTTASDLAIALGDDSDCLWRTIGDFNDHRELVPQSVHTRPNHLSQKSRSPPRFISIAPARQMYLGASLCARKLGFHGGSPLGSLEEAIAREVGSRPRP